MQNKLIVIRGGGDLASGVALRLHHAGFSVIILELDTPLMVRRSVSFADAVYQGHRRVEDVTARLVSADQIMVTLEVGEIPVLVDPQANILRNQFVTSPQSTIVVDARLLKTTPELLDVKFPLYIGLGPGFVAGENCTAVIETRRGHTMGRVYWRGSAQSDSGEPEGDRRRVLRAPADGALDVHVEIGEHVKEGQVIATLQPEIAMDDFTIVSPFDGILRGMIHSNVRVTRGLKIGDVDRRNDPALCALVSDKALAVGGGVLEAVLAFFKNAEE
jgi:xanthine dehydrogenase accessory factor